MRGQTILARLLREEFPGDVATVRLVDCLAHRHSRHLPLMVNRSFTEWSGKICSHRFEFLRESSTNNSRANHGASPPTPVSTVTKAPKRNWCLMSTTENTSRNVQIILTVVNGLLSYRSVMVQSHVVD